MIQLEERLYTSTEVAEVLGVSLRSVYRYLEEGKLDAEIKTATGRHRFSKSNIIDFLYPSGETPQRDTSSSKVQQSNIKSNISDTTSVSTEEGSFVASTTVVEEVAVKEETPEILEPVKTEEPKVVSEEVAEEEPVDWLAKFREAAKKYREEAEAKPNIESTKPQQDIPQESFAGFSPVQEPVQERETTKVLYYRSSLGGLKEIAQNIDKSSRNASVGYAFTLNAGLSLFKPIKPFSLLHAYVKPQDLIFFEKSLALTPSEETGAQLSLLVSSDESIFEERQEMHGLYVVSKKRLLDDISKMGTGGLEDEVKGVL